VAFATLNGVPIHDGRICMPRIGAWHADLAATMDAPSGRCTLAIDGGPTLVGTAHRSGSWLDTAHVRMVAGADGLGKRALPRHYRGASLRIVLLDLLATAGETLSGAAGASVLRLNFDAWTTIGQSVGRMIGALLADSRLPAATAWRLLPDGTLWVGQESWPDSGLAPVTDYQDLSEDPAIGALELGVEEPTLLPGTLLGGRKVSYVEHRISGETTRTSVWVEG